MGKVGGSQTEIHLKVGQTFLIIKARLSLDAQDTNETNQISDKEGKKKNQRKVIKAITQAQLLKF